MQINNTQVVFGKIFDVVPATVVAQLQQLGKRKVVFIDTPPVAQLVEIATALREGGIEVLVRDHHRPMGSTARDMEVLSLLDKVVAVVGSDKAVFTTRKEAASCARLVSLGEFADQDTVLFVDRDKDGFWSAMRASGVDYPELVTDADLLDGPRQKQNRSNGLSELGDLFARAMAALPQFAPNLADKSLQAWESLCSRFLLTLLGDATARASLEADAAAYEAQVAEAKRIAAEATEVVQGVWLADTMSAGRYDLTTLSADLEAKDGCKITVLKKKDGPIAAAEKKAGRDPVQYSLAVKKDRQEAINLQLLLPAGFISSPDTGVISNTTFLLHLNEGMWSSEVLPRLKGETPSAS